MTNLAPKLTRLVRNIGRSVMARFEGRKVEIDEYEDAIEAELAKENLNHPEFRRDIARTFARFDVATRAKVNPFKEGAEGGLDPALFRASDFTNGVIRLGNRTFIRMADATAQNWLQRMTHEQRAAEDSQRAATRTAQFLQTQPGVILMENPRLRTAEAMQQLRLWTDEDLADVGGDESEGDE